MATATETVIGNADLATASSGMSGLVIGNGGERGRGTMIGTVTVGTGTEMDTENDTTETVTTVVVDGMTTSLLLSQCRRIVIVALGTRRSLLRNRCDNMIDHRPPTEGGHKMTEVTGGVRHVGMGGMVEMGGMGGMAEMGGTMGARNRVDVVKLMEEAEAEGE